MYKHIAYVGVATVCDNMRCNKVYVKLLCTNIPMSKRFCDIPSTLKSSAGQTFNALGRSKQSQNSLELLNSLQLHVCR